MRLLIAFCFLFLSFSMYSQQREIIHLWTGKVPGEIKPKQLPSIDSTRADNVIMYTEVTDPVMEVYLPDPAVSNHSAVVICPGGGYRILAYNKEGTEIAAWLNKLGFTAFVLQYRIPDKKAGALQDVQRAIRLVRANAGRWDIDAEKTGVMGFSAGGSLSARASVLFNNRTYIPVDIADSLSCRPDFSLLIYPAYLDEGPDKTITPEIKIMENVPPVFIFQTADDTYGNSALVMAGALRDSKIPVELHILPFGGHGYGLRPVGIAAETWPVLAEKWLYMITKAN